MRKQLTDNMIEAIKLYDTTSMRALEICESTGVSPQALYGVLSGRTELSPRIQRAVEIYEKEDISLTALAKQLGTTRKILSKHFKNLGIEVKQPLKKYFYDEDYFRQIDHPDKAYWLGFIYADGSITESKTDIKLEIGIKDREHLIKFANCIGLPESKVKERTSKCKGKIYTSYRITVNSTKLCRDLIQLGAVPKKSLILTFPDFLEDQYISHFIRGYFDGDGCLNIRTQPSGNKTARVNFVGTLEFLTGIQDHYYNKFGVAKTKIVQKQGQKAYTFEKSGDGCWIMLDDMYKDCAISLDRKYAKYFAVSSRNTCHNDQAISVKAEMLIPR